MVFSYDVPSSVVRIYFLFFAVVRIYF